MHGNSSIITDSLVVDNNNFPELHYSVLVLTIQLADMDKTPVAFYAYVMQGTGEKIPTRLTTVGNQQVEEVRLPSDAWDHVLRNIIANEVQKKYPNSVIFEAGGSVVDPNLELSDREPENQHYLFINGQLACRGALDYHLNPNDLELKNFDNRSVFSVTVERSNEDEVLDRVGLPVRTDMLITTVVRSQQNNGSSLNQRNSAIISRVGGYIDLMWTRPAQQQQAAWLAPQQPVQFSPIYTPMFVITQGTPEFLQSIPSQLLMLSSAACITESTNWTFNFMPRRMASKDDLNLRDISALGFDINAAGNPDGVGNRITGLEDLTPVKLNSLFASICTPVPVLALDVFECGASTWEHSVFAAAADGSSDAISDIVYSLDKLTNGGFSRIWNPENKICFQYGGRTPAGFYTGKDGKRKDIRNIDYLAMLNLFGDRDMNVVRRFSEAWNNASLSFDQRTKWRKEVTDNLGATYVGWYRRIVFSTAFIKALTTSLRESGLVYAIDTPYTEVSADVRTPVSFLGQVMQTTPTPSGLYAVGGYATNGNVYGTTPFQGYVYQHTPNGFNL